MSEKEIKDNIDQHIGEITNEFKNGFEFIKKYPKSVTIFGSARLTKASSHYNDAEKLAEKIVKELGYAVVTGGGPGIMEAANMGAKNASGQSIGLNIKLPMEQHINPHATDSMTFQYFFSRKAMLAFAAEAYVFFPGGYGTFDELFGILTLMQTKKIPSVPVVLFGKDFWNPVKDFIRTNMLSTHHTIGNEDLELFVISDSVDQTIRAIKGAPVSRWWNLFD
jgi:uncharacterized protein (TIGR00730 family)